MKVGDWVFCEFDLVEIREVAADGRVTMLADGMFERSVYDFRDRIFPLTRRGNRIVAHFQIASRDLHTMHNLNFPDIHRELVARWVKAMAGSDEVATEVVNALREWVREIDRARDVVVGGVSVFRRR